ncbi:MAG: hypothetical protein NZ869_06825 [Thermoanaerobaculum sp.]|nr:hypothetical protein [Thermoanaerobaculum sp.]MDW7966578.1 hypothetical protein [Thermoanaerobaculum sp.]
MADHFTLMTLHALLLAVFFSFLWKKDAAERRRYLIKVFLILLGGAVALGWLMYPFPRPS